MTYIIRCGRCRSYWPRGRRLEGTKKNNNIIPYYGLVYNTARIFRMHSNGGNGFRNKILCRCNIYVFIYIIFLSYIVCNIDQICAHVSLLENENLIRKRIWLNYFTSMLLYIILFYRYGKKYYVFTNAHPNR